MTSFKKTQLLIICLVFFGALLAGCGTSHEVMAAAENSVAIDLSKTVVEGGASAPAAIKNTTATINGASLPALEITAQFRKSYNAVIIPAKVDGEKFNTLQFKARLVSSAEPKLKSFDVWILAKDDWASTSFLKHAKELKDGWYQFSWDMVNQPDNKAGIDYANLREVRLRYPFGAVAEGRPDVIEIADMKFVSGLRAQSGDPALYDQWKKFVANYKPDYSDSSKYLLPPQTGRIAKPIPFIKDGRALGEIVLPANASDPMKMAGNELRHWLQEITKADVPIVAVPGGGAAPRVLLGTQFAAGKFDADLKWLKDIGKTKGSDGFAVRADKNNVYIFGATDKGTLNGVFKFLENNTDIIWPRGNVELGVVFTPRPSFDIVWADARDMPVTALRGWGLHDPPGALDWQTRNGINYVAPEGTLAKSQAVVLQRHGNYIQFGGGHNISYFLGKNPAFYPVIDGQQVTEFNIWKHQPNFTAPGITDAVAQNMIQYIKERAPEGVDCVNINIEDNWGLSTDPKSLEPIKLPDGTTITKDDPAFRSTQFFIFLNEVVRKVNAVYPEMMIGTYAYFFTATVPKVPIDPNIRVFFAPYPRKDYRSPLFSPINDHWWLQMVGWTKKTPNIVMREYYGIFNGFRPLAEVVGAEVKSYMAHGITNYTAEIFGDSTAVRGDALRGDRAGWDFLAMEYWLTNRIYWNPDQDIEQLRKYYIRRVYHEAAPQVERFFGTIRTAWYKNKTSSGFIDSVRMMDRLVIKGGLEDELRQNLEGAAKAVKNPQSQFAINVLRLTFEEWISAAKTKQPEEKSAFKFAPDVQLRYGWQAMNDWEQQMSAWALATYTARDGKAVPAVRFTTQADRANGKDFTITNPFAPGLLLLKNGDTLEFTIAPADKTELSAPLQIGLTATDKDNKKLPMPDSAIEKLPHGSLRVKWQLQSSEAFDVLQLKQLALTIPNAVCAGKGRVVFYITEMTIQR